MTAAVAWLEYETQAADDKSAAAASLLKRLNLRTVEYPINRSDAKKRAATVSREAMRAADDPAELNALCESHGVEYPVSKYGRHCEVERLKDAGWWGRKIRVSDWRAYERQQLNLGLVRHFVSDEIAQARTWHRAAIAELLESLTAVRDDGAAIMTLKNLADTSTSNPAHRRAEMIVRAKGLARWRAQQGYTWTFATLTAPSKYHRLRTENGRLVANPKWEGATPRETQAYHNRVFARIRAALQRAGVKWSAFRTVEPHADATPHWHLCVFCLPADLQQIKTIFLRYALQEDGTERGAAEHRCKFEDYRPERGGSVEEMADRCIAYLIAYVSKNIDGLKTVTGEAQAAADSFDIVDGQRVELGPAVESARRVEAWATLWGIRQFQELGGGPVTAYRELRRLREPLADSEIETARAAADAGNYGEFIAATRQIDLELWSETTRDRLAVAATAAGIPANTATQELADIAIQQGLLNRWGEPCRRWVRGVRAMGRTVLTKMHTWTIVDQDGLERIALSRALAKCAAAMVPLATSRYYGPEEALAHERALALAPGFFFSRAAPPRALDLCQ